MKKIDLILMVFAFLVSRASPGQSVRTSAGVGDNTSEFSVVDVSGDEVRLSDFNGNKNVVLFFYLNSL